MQPKAEIEKHYEKPDPWGYQKSPSDQNRKRILTMALQIYGPYEKLLDIGAGEGWLTKDYPAPVLHGFELSDNAASRFPPNVTRVLRPEGMYDIITCTGIFYPHYDCTAFMKMILDHGSKHVLVSSIKAWEHPCVSGLGEIVHKEEFKYNEHVQHMRLFKLRV